MAGAVRETPADTIRERGVLVPILVRLRKCAGTSADTQGYELIAGHRRKHACALAGLDIIPVILRDLDDDAAAIALVDSNLHRENISPSERAKAYKMKLEAIKRQGARNDLTSRQTVGRCEPADVVGQDLGKIGRQIQRYIYLTALIPTLLALVDGKQIAVSPAIELSYLSPEEQALLLDAMADEQSAPSLSQAQRLKKISRDSALTFEAISAVLAKEKKGTWDAVTLSGEKLCGFFPNSYTPRQMEQTIWSLLETWQKAIQNKKKAS